MTFMSFPISGNLLVIYLHSMQSNKMQSKFTVHFCDFICCGVGDLQTSLWSLCCEKNSKAEVMVPYESQENLQVNNLLFLTF